MNSGSLFLLARIDIPNLMSSTYPAHASHLHPKGLPMCLAVPAKLSQCHNGEALADLHGNHVRVSTILLPDSKDGDWVLVHAGFAIQRLDEQEAQATWAILQDMQKAHNAQTPEGQP